MCPIMTDDMSDLYFCFLSWSFCPAPQPLLFLRISLGIWFLRVEKDGVAQGQQLISGVTNSAAAETVRLPKGGSEKSRKK